MRKSFAAAFMTLGLLLAWGVGPARAAFELEHPGARAAGLGGAFVAVADDADSLNYNPAGLGNMPHSVVSFNYARLLTGLDDGTLSDSQLAYIQPLGGIGTFGFDWYQRTLMNLYQENTYALAYGLSLDDKNTYQVGGTIKILQQNYLDSQAINENPYFSGRSSVAGLALDLGALAALTDSFRVGLSIFNVNQPNLSLGGGESIVPYKIQAGGAYQGKAWLGTFEVSYFDQHYRICSGGEAWWFNDILATRLGIGIGDQDLSELSLGLSARVSQDIWSGQFDYAFVLPLGGMAGAGGTHQVNFTVFFGNGFESEKVRHAKEQAAAGDQARARGKIQEALADWEEAAEVLDHDDELAEKIAVARKEARRNHEVELLIKRGLEYEKNGNYLNASASYRKAASMQPDDPQANKLLKQVDEKLRDFSGRQQEVQAEKEKKQSERVEKQNELRATQAVERAAEVWEKTRKNSRWAEHFPQEWKRLDGQLRDANTLLSKHEYDQAQVLAQDLISETAKLEQRIQRAEQEKAQKAKPEKRSQERAAKAELQPEVPAVVAAAPATVPEAVPTSSQTIPASNPVKMFKRARGAYGRLVKLMLDIDKANGQKYYPDKVDAYRKELAKIKGLLETRDYPATMAAADKLYPEVQKLKADCEDKEKAQKAMPTNW